MQMISSQQYY